MRASSKPIAAPIDEAAPAVPVLDQAGWHMAGPLTVPD